MIIAYPTRAWSQSSAPKLKVVWYTTKGGCIIRQIDSFDGLLPAGALTKIKCEASRSQVVFLPRIISVLITCIFT